jgi:hypothetical protein
MTVRRAYARTARHGMTVVLTVTTATLGLLGCGIRSTDIPVDAGPAQFDLRRIHVTAIRAGVTA